MYEWAADGKAFYLGKTTFGIHGGSQSPHGSSAAFGDTEAVSSQGEGDASGTTRLGPTCCHAHPRPGFGNIYSSTRCSSASGSDGSEIAAAARAVGGRACLEDAASDGGVRALR